MYTFIHFIYAGYCDKKELRKKHSLYKNQFVTKHPRSSVEFVTAQQLPQRVMDHEPYSRQNNYLNIYLKISNKKASRRQKQSRTTRDATIKAQRYSLSTQYINISLNSQNQFVVVVTLDVEPAINYFPPTQRFAIWKNNILN